MQFLENVKLTLCAAGAGSAGTDVAGSVIDMLGYEGVIFFTTIATANAGNYLRALHGDTNSPSDTVEGSKVIVDSDGDGAILEIHRPQKRYVKPEIERGGANTATGDLWALQYGPGKRPKTNDITNTQNAVVLSFPATGTP